MAFNPLSFPNLKLWLDASDASTVTVVGTAVEQWDDKSGNGYHFYQSTTINKPVYGTTTHDGLNTMKLSDSANNGGDTRCLIHPTKANFDFLVADTGCTIYEVCKVDAGNASQSTFGNVNTGAGNTAGLRSSVLDVTGTETGGITCYRAGVSNPIASSTAVVDDGVWGIRVYTLLPGSATGLTFQCDALTAASASTVGFTGTVTTQHFMTVGGTGASTTTGAPSIGGPQQGVELATFLVYQGVHTAGQQTLIRNGLLGVESASDIPFLQANDRYQVVACANAGTTTSTSQFRYWYSGAPEWDLALEEDTQYPPFHTLDEYSSYPTASLETPFKSLKTGQEDQIQGVYVEFYARPTSLTETTVTSTYSVGFTCRVEGVSTPNYSRTVSTTLTSGIIVSDDQTYESTAEVHASDTWPNLRTVFLPCRMPGKIRAARVILSDIHLVAIRRVQLMGKLTPGRDA